MPTENLQKYIPQQYKTCYRKTSRGETKIKQMRCFNIIWHINTTSGKTRMFQNAHK